MVCCTIRCVWRLFSFVFLGECMFRLCVFVLLVWTIRFIKTSDYLLVSVKDYGHAKNNHGNGLGVSGHKLGCERAGRTRCNSYSF
jgi:hypothetical protein